MREIEQHESNDLRLWTARPLASAHEQSTEHVLNRSADRMLRMVAWFAVLGSAITCVAIVMPTLTTPHDGILLDLHVLAACTAVLAATLFQVARGVRRGRAWARVLGLVCGVMTLVGFPVGTLIGSYLLWRLLFRWQPIGLNPAH